MKNIQVIEGAENCVYDIFAATDEEFSVIFAPDQDIAFIDEVWVRVPAPVLKKTLAKVWKRRLRKTDANGIHGIMFYQLQHKKAYYPTRRDEEARNPDGSRLR